jgi:2-hydroxy-6-oxonona-2,4-dienedioate hydrolase
MHPDGTLPLASENASPPAPNPDLLALTGHSQTALMHIMASRDRTGETVSVKPHQPSKNAMSRLIIPGLIAAAVAGIVTCFSAAQDLRRITARLDAASALTQTRHGHIEFARRGSGPAVLVIHGAGGGYDQGLLIPRVFGGDGYQWISVSRFGYLRSVLPNDGSTMAQAEAFADLLDALAIERIAIVAMSGGVPPALQFAARYPDRTTALILLSAAPFSPLTARSQDLPMPAWAYQALFRSDFVFWAVVNGAPTRLDRVFDITPAARARMTAADKVFVDGLVDAFLPVTTRAPGLRNEGAAIDPAAHYDLARITAPTLIVHARDDGINPFAIGTYTADHIAGAAFMAVPSGGHLLLGHTEAVRARVMDFLLTYAK